MKVTEKAAYLKGLAEGLAIDSTTPEGKLLLAMIDVMGEMAETISGMEEMVDDLNDVVDELDQDLGELEEDFYAFDEDEEDEEDDEEDEAFESGALYEVTCANCGDKIYLDDENLKEGSIECPNCGKLLEFTYDDSEDYEEDDNELPDEDDEEE